MLGERLVRMAVSWLSAGQMDPKSCKRRDPKRPCSVRCCRAGQAFARGRSIAVEAVESLTSQPMIGGRAMVRCVTVLRAGLAFLTNAASFLVSFAAPVDTTSKNLEVGA